MVADPSGFDLASRLTVIRLGLVTASRFGEAPHIAPAFESAQNAIAFVVIVSKSPNPFPTKPLTSHAPSAWWLETESYARIAW